ncbi:phthiocerol/phthiodiolone dimycocerosyl transferase family protein [Micromonospora sp. RTGN7]|uniref:phthiocerol/phthiodiolone dimycocerosyl transferase family protein n=1 Tax=Micromonospora sp. RTGN7 TaxID=3016526 RepID=UPI0029FEC88D|nr:acyltransferase [Micromonospora sp. RTGN7]
MTRVGLRALSPTERVHARKEAYIGYAVHAVGRLNPDALTTAYEAVRDAYPQLAARLEADDDGPVFAESGARQQVRFCDGDVEQPLTGVELNQLRSLSALNVVYDGDEASVCLALHHSIADAQHAIEVLVALWSCYTDVVNGVPLDLPSHPYPRSLEDLLAERGIHAHAPGAARTPMPLPSQAMSPPARVVRHVVQHRLTAAQTTALVERAHREHVTINGLLSGTILLAEAEIRGLPLSDLVYRYAVNLRQHLSPPVGATEGTNVLGGVGFRVTDGIEPDAVSIGRAIGEQLRAGLTDGSIQRSLLDIFHKPAPGARPWDPHLTPAVVSMMNWGVVPPIRPPDGLRLTNLRSASYTREAVALGGYVVSTFDGRLGIDLAWPEGDPELPRRIDCLREQLGRVTSDL